MKSEEHPITVFLGFYNAEKYLESMLDQIKSQSNQNFQLLVVDNNSQDSTYEKINTWIETFGPRIELVKNSINYGAYGSLFKNIEKIKTPWFCWIHQDDFYKPNHIETLLEMINRGDASIIGVSTTMGSLTYSGKIMNSKPRSTWFTQESDQAGQFLQNLKAQAFPDPASAYKLEIFKKTPIPVHSSSFPDTEHTLKMLGYGKFLVSEKETMLYRENPYSDSHVLNSVEREVGAVLGLIRVFNSDEFEMLLNTIESQKQGQFATQFLVSLSYRITTPNLLKIIEISALEKMSMVWGYNQRDISELLIEKYATFSSSLTINTLKNLSQTHFTKENSSLHNSKDTININSRIWEWYFNSQIKLFKKYNKKILKTIYQIIFLIKPKHRWNNRWK